MCNHHKIDWFCFLKEGGELSLTRLLALVGFAAFLVCSVYLVLTGTTWGNYDTFALFAGGGATATQLTNKFINSKYNTHSGEYFPPKQEPK